MPEQLHLDSWIGGQRPPRARRKDPESSHRAADQAERRGQIESEMRAARRATRGWPGRTSRELSQLTGLDRHMLARRLPEIERKRLVRSNRDPQTGKPPAGESLRWWWRDLETSK